MTRRTTAQLDQRGVKPGPAAIPNETGSGAGADTTGGGYYGETRLYDVLHAPDTAAECRTLRALAGRFAPKRGVWLEPACGTGRHGRWLAKHAGVRSVGFDCYRTMVEDALARAARSGVGALAKFVVADMVSFADALPARATGRIAFAFNLINSVRHLPSDRAMRQHFNEVRRVLSPGGVYAVGLHTAAYGFEVPTRDEFVAARGQLRITQRVRYLPAPGPRDRVERVESVVTATTPRGRQVFRSRYGLRSYSPQEWSGLIRRAGWRVCAVTDEDGASIDLDRSGRAPAGAYAVWVLAPATGSQGPD